MGFRRTLRPNTESGSPDVDTDAESRSPWRWLGRFGKFLLFWPVLSLSFGGEVIGEESTALDDFLLMAFVPALVGGVLIGVDWFLTRTLGHVVAKRGHPVPSVLRDCSNVCLTLVVLTLPGVVFLVIDGAHTAADVEAATFLALIQAGALGFRLLSRLSHGPNRQTGLGGRWNQAPTILRWLGYGALIPLFIVVVVMLVDPTFTLGQSCVLLYFFWMALRSAMARAPGVWAAQPWEATLRRFSLWFPWVATVALLFLAFGTLGVAFPFLYNDGGAMAVAGWVVMFPLGILSFWFTFVALWRLGQIHLPRLRVSWALNRRPSDLKSWILERDGTLALSLWSRAAAGRWKHPAPELVAYLEELPNGPYTPPHTRDGL